MLEILYTTEYIRAYKKLPLELKNEVKEKVEQFKNPRNHVQLRLHKLHGDMKSYHSFSVNYSVRVIVRLVKKKAIAFMIDIGSHDVYQ